MGTPVLGFATGAASMVLQNILLRSTQRKIGGLVAQVTLEEEHHDELEITSRPVEYGAVVSDHCFMRPARLTIRCGFSESPSPQGLLAGLGSVVTGTIAGAEGLLNGPSTEMQDTYTKFRALQASGAPFDIVTGKRVYNNMLITSLSTTTTDKTEHGLILVVSCKQVLIAYTQVINTGATANAADQQTTPPPTAQAGTKSAQPVGNTQ